MIQTSTAKLLAFQKVKELGKKQKENLYNCSKNSNLVTLVTVARSLEETATKLLEMLPHLFPVSLSLRVTMLCAQFRFSVSTAVLKQGLLINQQHVVIFYCG